MQSIFHSSLLFPFSLPPCRTCTDTVPAGFGRLVSLSGTQWLSSSHPSQVGPNLQRKQHRPCPPEPRGSRRRKEQSSSTLGTNT